LDAFFTTLASLRSNDGVPICVVVIDGTPGGLGDRLSRLSDLSLWGASGGVAARDLLVPLPEVQLGVFVQIEFLAWLKSTSILTSACLYLVHM
jgi:hypothetical protein